MVNFGENWLNFGDNCLDDYNNQKTIKRRLIEQTNEFLGAEIFDREEILPKVWKKYVARWKTTKCTKHSIKAIHTSYFDLLKHP